MGQCLHKNSENKDKISKAKVEAAPAAYQNNSF
jgi:hypothetical protein